MSNHIYEDLWAEILKRLPVKSICQIRCVCKSWNSLLSSPSFSSLHLRFTATTTETTYLQVSDKETTAYTLHDQDTLIPRSLEFPLSSPGVSLFIGFVHGVVCFTHFPDQASRFQPLITFWNPVIHKYIDTPLPSYIPIKKPERYRYLRGLGFDSSKNDIKLVLCPCHSEGTRYYHVFSVREGVWRSGKPLPQHIASPLYYCGESRFLNGTIHWLTFQGLYSLLLFDCEREEFRTMDLPERVNRGLGVAWAQLVVCDGLLQVMKSFSVILGRKLDWFMVWKMEKDGDATTTWTEHEIWAKVHEFVFKKITSLKDGFVFKESMLLMDDGNPIELRGIGQDDSVLGLLKNGD